jgi:hypothetical protein
MMSDHDYPIDPDCISDKHKACPGWTWNETTDSSDICACPCHDDPSILEELIMGKIEK